MKRFTKLLLGVVLSLVWQSWASAQTCTYTLSSSNQTFTALGGTGTFTVNTSTDCVWTATSSVVWITITDGVSGAGTGTVSYSVAPNTSSASQIGLLTVADQTNTVTQAGLRAVICPVKMTGVLTYTDVDENLIRALLHKNDIISDPSDRLALELDLDNSTLRLIEIDSDNTEVAELAVSMRCAFLPQNLFAGDLIFDALTVYNDTLGLDFDGSGSWQVRGKYTTDTNGVPNRVSTKLLGVMNDPVNGNPDAPAAMFKGVFTSDGHSITP